MMETEIRSMVMKIGGWRRTFVLYNEYAARSFMASRVE